MAAAYSGQACSKVGERVMEVRGATVRTTTAAISTAIRSGEEEEEEEEGKRD